jgi:hypothetical protein
MAISIPKLLNTRRQTRKPAVNDSSSGELRNQLVAETGGRNGGGRERWVKPGNNGVCRAAVASNGNVQRETGMAVAAWTQVQAPPQQVPLQPRLQSWPLSWLPGTTWRSTVVPGVRTPCAICMQWCSVVPCENGIWASAPRNGVIASARARRYSDNLWNVPTMKKRVALVPGNTQAGSASFQGIEC